MIHINLVPLETRQKSTAFPAMRIDIPQEILLGVGGGCVFVLILVHLVLLGALVVKGIVLAQHQSAWQAVLPGKKTIDTIGDELKDLKKKMGNITDVTNQKAMGWSRQLNIISDAMPKGMWLNQITVKSSTLIIEGSVFSKNQNEVSTVGDFVAHLKSQQHFMDSVSSLEVKSIQRNKLGASDVANFTVTASLK